MLDNCVGEILSPVGNRNMLIAAVRSGADAVYLGAKDFSARRNAENFTLNELAEIIKYCHIRNVKVYLALNILIKDREFSSALNLALNAYNAGIDGIIVQDLGLAKVLHEKLPELPLHASTQMSIHTPSCLPLLKELGFKQVVAAREMSLKDLTEFCEEAEKYNITVEAFVHGALCMSVSGQCLLSAFLGSRSGNRGLCAGPCRLPFSAANGTGFDLSLKDLSLIEEIPTLYKIGVRSFKIEGRMKRPEYVAAATKACRDALINGKVEPEFLNALKNVFSRSGFTKGYFENKLGRNMFGIRTKEDVIAADKAFPLFQKLYRKEIKKVGININTIIKKDMPVTVSFSDGENTVTATGNIPEIAKTKALTHENILNNLTKLGDTPYYNIDCNINADTDIFVSASELNYLRRQCCELLDTARSKIKRAPQKAEYKITKSINKNQTPNLVIRIETHDQLPKNLNGIKAVIVPLEKDFEPIPNITNILDIPRGIMNEKNITDYLLECKQKGFDLCLCGNLSALKIARSLGFSVIADTGLNIHNSPSAEAIYRLGAKAVILSNELTINDIAELNSPIPKGIISYGHIPLMLFKNCPIKNGTDCKSCDKKQVLTDRFGTRFPVKCRLGYSELLNSVPIWLGDKQKNLSGIDFQVLYFTNETQNEVSQIINAYKDGEEADFKYTRGLFFKGTI